MPGGRRIIYIKNPKSGSHFRNIGGSGGGGGGGSSGSGSTPSQSPTGGNLPTSSQAGVPQWNGTEWSNLPAPSQPGTGWNLPTGENYGGWANFGDPLQAQEEGSSNPYAGLDFGTLPGYGVGPYQAPTFEAFVPSETLWGMIYDIATGVDPYTGDYQPGYGAPGTLVFGAAVSEGSLLEYQIHSAGYGPRGKSPGRFAGDYHFGGRPKVKKRPWFLK